jgi:adenosylcobinamide amidohydrolase
VLTVLDLGEPLRAFGNLVYSADRVRAVLFYQVERCVEDFEGLAQRLVEGVGRGDLAVFFTAADVSRIRAARGRLADVYATIGLTNPACLRPKGDEAGCTINLAVVSKVGLSRRGLVDLFRTAAEAKAASLTSLGLCGRCEPALGTTSDAILALAPDGPSHYAGLATELGAEAAELIYGLLSRHARGL